MKLLYSYLRNYWPLVALALALATINQVFSLLDPLIFRYVIDEYATRFQEYTTGEFFRGVTLLLAAAVGVAFVSRVAKNFARPFCTPGASSKRGDTTSWSRRRGCTTRCGANRSGKDERSERLQNGFRLRRRGSRAGRLSRCLRDFVSYATFPIKDITTEATRSPQRRVSEILADHSVTLHFSQDSPSRWLTVCRVRLRTWMSVT